MEWVSPIPSRLSTPPGSLYGRNLVTVTNRAVNPIHHPIKGCDLTPPLVATNQAHARSFQNRTPPKPDLGRQPGLLPWMGRPGRPHPRRDAPKRNNPYKQEKTAHGCSRERFWIGCSPQKRSKAPTQGYYTSFQVGLSKCTCKEVLFYG